jgi:hypothetical protein
LRLLVTGTPSGRQRCGICWITGGSLLILPAGRGLISGPHSDRRRQRIASQDRHIEWRQFLRADRRRKRLARISLRGRIVLRHGLAEAD